MATAEGLISLSERLRQHAQRLRRRGYNDGLAVDLRYAAYAARRLAALLIADEAASESDPLRQRDLAAEAMRTWREAGHG